MIEIRVQRITGDRGTDLKPVDESVYDDEEFVTAVAKEINEIVRKEDPGTNGTWRATWDKIKTKVRKMTVDETNKKRKKNNIEVKRLRELLWAKNVEITEGRANAAQTAEYMRLAKELDEKTKQEASLHQSVEEIAYNLGKMHDVCSAAFYRPWKPKGAAQWIARIFKADWTDTQNPQKTGQHCSDPKEIVNEVTEYWRSLFTRKATDPVAHEACLDTLRTGNRVLPPTAEKCGAPIDDAETRATCNTLPTGKSAGPDRIPNKFYKVFSKIVAPILTEVFNESHAAKAFPEGFSAGIITTLYKKKARDDPRNYRPITLLNTDYKMYTRILSRRMRQVVHEFISTSQKGFMPRELIQDCSMLLHLTEAYINEEPEERKGIFVFFDMEKAFDRVSYKFLNQALEATGFGPKFRKSVHQFYDVDNAPQRRILTNGYYSDFSLSSQA